MAKYNSKIAKEIYSNVASGLSQKDSATLAGISEDTFYAWRKEKSEFSESVERAILLYKQGLVSKVNSYAFKDGRLALEVLSRRWPDEFGKRDTLPIPKEEPNVKPMNEETAQAILGMLNARERRIKEQHIENPESTSGIYPRRNVT